MQPAKLVERQLMELCIRGAIQDIKISGQTGVSETKNAVQVMRLIEDFLFVSGTFDLGDDVMLPQCHLYYLHGQLI